MTGLLLYPQETTPTSIRVSHSTGTSKTRFQSRNCSSVRYVWPGPMPVVPLPATLQTTSSAWDRLQKPEASIVTPPSALFSGLLKPERKKRNKIGMDLRFFDQNRLEFDFSFTIRIMYTTKSCPFPCHPLPDTAKSGLMPVTCITTVMKSS